MHSVVVYTANIGGYDAPRPPSVPGRFVMFTDGPAVDGWKHCRICPSDNPVRQARYYKLLPHLMFFAPEAQYTIWLDASTALAVPPEIVVSEWLGDDYDIALFRHPVRDCIYAEAEACIAKGKDSPEVIRAQMDRYRRAGFPQHYGLAETPVIVRRTSPVVAQFCDEWWGEARNGSVRDQLSFDFVRWRFGGRVRVNFIDGGNGWRKRKHPWFDYTPHVKAGGVRQ